MPVRSVSDAQIAIPDNAQLLEFPRSDAVSTESWPSQTTEVVDQDGHVNFFKYLPDDQGPNRRWRIIVGAAVAKALNKPEGPPYVLASFPQKYGFFDHHKGPQENPRHDLYLYGPRKKRFRSCNEFIPHAIWLMSPNNENETCVCKYCSGPKAQREITASFSEQLGIRVPSPSAPAIMQPRIRAHKEKKKDPAEGSSSSVPRRKLRPPPVERDVVSVMQKKVEPLPPGPDILDDDANSDSQRDLRAVYAKPSKNLRRYARKGEIVWCRIFPSISSLDLGVGITWWPGIVHDYRIKSVPIPKSPSTNASSTSTPGPSSLNPASGHVAVPAASEPRWEVKQFFMYRVLFLGTMDVIHEMVDHNVMPYTSYCPSDELLHIVHEVFSTRPSFSMDTTDRFNPLPGKGSSPKFLDAAAPFASALEIASSVAACWSTTDDFTMNFGNLEAAPETGGNTPTGKQDIIMTPTPSQPTQLQTQPTTNPINAPSSSSAVQHEPGPTDQVLSGIQDQRRRDAKPYKAVSSINPNVSEQDTLRISNHVVGVQECVPQTRYQGVWWGCERIWLGDLLQLKIRRQDLAMNGAPHILPVGGNGPDPAAGMRGVFLRLEGLFAAKIIGEGGRVRHEPRFCGQLYELVDETWEESDPWTKDVPPSLPNPISTPPDPFLSLTAIPASELVHLPPQKDVLPEAPAGYKFRLITQPGWEFVGTMPMIGGRYYPRMTLSSQEGGEGTVRNGLHPNSRLLGWEQWLGRVHQDMVAPYKYVKWQSAKEEGVYNHSKARQRMVEECVVRIKEDMNRDSDVQPMDVQPSIVYVAPIPVDDAMMVD